MSTVVPPSIRDKVANVPFSCVLPGGVITYIGSSSSSPSRTSPESLYSDSSNGSFQSLTQGGLTTYFPPSPTGSLTQDPARSFGGIAPSLSEDGSPSSSSSSSSSSYNGSPSGSLQVAVEDSSRVSPSKSTSTITSESLWLGLVVGLGRPWGLLQNCTNPCPAQSGHFRAPRFWSASLVLPAFGGVLSQEASRVLRH